MHGFWGLLRHPWKRFPMQASRRLHESDRRSMNWVLRELVVGKGAMNLDRSRLVALEEAPEEPIYSSGPEIYRPGACVFFPGRIREPKAPESGRENSSGGRATTDFRPGTIDRLLLGLLQSHQSGTVKTNPTAY